MNELLKIILSLSLSGSILIIALFFLKGLFKKTLSKRWQYYIWLVVIIRMFLPFTAETSLMGAISQGFEPQEVQAAAPSTPVSDQDAVTEILTDIINIEAATNQENSDNTALNPTPPATPAAPSQQGFVAILWQNPWLIWLFVAVILLIRKVTIYQSFIKYIKAGCVEVANIDMLEQFGKLIEKNNIKGNVELYTNKLVSTPLMIGFFRPCIILPTADLPTADFEYTVLHELTHYKRGDMFYKWLVQVTICLHWFNPLVYLMGNDIGRDCELSCDEAVIRALDNDKRRDYGDTLINAIGVGGEYKNSLASVTLGESKKLLKERLDLIMTFKKKSRIATLTTIMLSLIICFSATYVGVYAAPYVVPSLASQSRPAGAGTGNTTNTNTNTITPIKNVKVDFDNVAIDIKGRVGVEIVKTDNKNVSFELLNVEDEKACKTSATVKNGTMQIAVDGGKTSSYTNSSGNNYTYNYNYRYDYDDDDYDDYDDYYDDDYDDYDDDDDYYDYDDDDRYYYNNRNNLLKVNFGPIYKNVIRVYVPNAVYKEFKITAEDVTVHIQDFTAAVKAEIGTGNIVLTDRIISQGSYDVKVNTGNFKIETGKLQSKVTANVTTGNFEADANSIEAAFTAAVNTGNLDIDVNTVKHNITLNVNTGNLEINVDTVQNDVTAKVKTGTLKMDFDRIPRNLYLDSSDCFRTIKRPTGWGSIYSVGNGKPKVTLSNSLGLTEIDI